MEELVDVSGVELATDGEGGPVWAAQGHPDGSLGPGVRAWRRGSAVAVASPDVSGRDRLAITGNVADATPLVRDVFDAVGPSYRMFGPAELVTGLVERLPGLGQVGELYWMEATSPPWTDSSRPDTSWRSCPRTEWLDEAGEKAAGELFDAYFPRSYAQPGRRGVQRWAGVLDAPDGTGREPLAVAAEAWSGAGCGFMAGVVTHPAARGRGLAQVVCGFVMEAVVRRYGRVALMAHADNAPAVAAYERLGMVKQPLRATSMTEM